MLYANDIIPLGVSPGKVSLLATKNGLNYIPPDSVVSSEGNGGMYEVIIDVTTQVNKVTAIMLGFKIEDIKTE